jgi:hypothetical protein
MSSFFAPSAPKPDKELERQRAEERRKLEEEKAAEEAKRRDTLAARMAGLRGTRSLLSGTLTGF